MNVVFKGSFFLDSNVWLYALAKKAEDSATVEKRRRALELTEQSGVVVSFQVINEVCANASKKINFTDDEILELIDDMYDGCVVIESSRDLSLRAVQLRTRYQFSFWDSFIVAAALQAEVPTLYSEDMQNGLSIDRQLQIVNPFV